jgi:ABC-type Fe3+ transport system substrate-binding protein
MQRRDFLQLAALGVVAPEVRAANLTGALTVLTSFPEPMLTRVEQAFSATYPNIRLTMLWRAGADALAYIRGAGRGVVDVYWAPSLHNFHALADEGVFRTLVVDRTRLPGRIGQQEQSDPHGRFEAVETAGFAIVCNEEYLRREGLEAPERFADLADPKYTGHLVLPVPSRIGFAPPLYEHLLQTYGWHAGFDLIARMAANAYLVSSSGTSVVDRVGRGLSGLGISMDFFAYNAAARGVPVSLTYPTDTLFSPAHIAISNQARQPDSARLFVDFILSSERQRLLLDPSIGRLPMRPTVYRHLPSGVIDPFSTADAGSTPHNTQLGLQRQPVVCALFDAAFTERHEKLTSLWGRIKAAEKQAGSNEPAVRQACLLSTAMPLTESEAADPRLARVLLSERSNTPSSPAMMTSSSARADLVAHWGGFFERNYAAALEALSVASLS